MQTSQSVAHGMRTLTRLVRHVWSLGSSGLGSSRSGSSRLFSRRFEWRVEPQPPKLNPEGTAIKIALSCAAQLSQSTASARPWARMRGRMRHGNDVKADIQTKTFNAEANLTAHEANAGPIISRPSTGESKRKEFIATICTVGAIHGAHSSTSNAGTGVSY